MAPKNQSSLLSYFRPSSNDAPKEAESFSTKERSPASNLVSSVSAVKTPAPEDDPPHGKHGRAGRSNAAANGAAVNGPPSSEPGPKRKRRRRDSGLCTVDEASESSHTKSSPAQIPVDRQRAESDDVPKTPGGPEATPPASLSVPGPPLRHAADVISQSSQPAVTPQGEDMSRLLASPMLLPGTFPPFSSGATELPSNHSDSSEVTDFRTPVPIPRHSVPVGPKPSRDSLCAAEELLCRAALSAGAGRAGGSAATQESSNADSLSKSPRATKVADAEPKEAPKLLTLLPSQRSEETGSEIPNAPQQVKDESTTEPDEEIEEPLTTDDDLERVDGRSHRGVTLLKANMKMQSDISTASTLFSAYSSTKSSDFASPSFSPIAFDPSEKVCGSGAKASFRFDVLSGAFDLLETLKGSGPGSKKKSAAILTNLFRAIIWWCPHDLIPAVYISLNKVAPDYVGLEIGVGEAMLVRIIVEIYGRSEPSIKADLKKYEDLGRVAEISRCSMRQLFKPKPLTISSVFRDLRGLAEITGKSSQDRKRDTIKKLLAAAQGSEPKAIVRFLQGKTRIGIQAVSVYQSLAYAFALTSPRHSPFSSESSEGCADRRGTKGMASSKIDEVLVAMEGAVRTALSEVSNIEVVIQHLFNGCSASDLLLKCSVTPGIPVQPMLAKPTKGLQEVLTRFANVKFTCEFKYDGERAQLHLLADGTILIFSRNLENLTSKYPDVIVSMRKALKPDVRECILDSEIVAVDKTTGAIRPFQILSTRKRKDVVAEDVLVGVCVYAFDCIQFNGERLTKIPLERRRSYLNRALEEVPREFMFAQHAEMTTLEEIDGFLQNALDANCEGLMVKTLTSAASYEPSRRSLNWLKIKKDYLEDLTDSVDLVPIGAYFGTGKRSKYYGSYLLACYDPDEEIFQTVCKTSTGFSDENLDEFYNKLQDHLITVKSETYRVTEDKRIVPDVWFEPVYVWEIRAADLSISPVHTGALGIKHPTKGVALRFPRFVRERSDKKPEQATSSHQIADMYENQFSQPNKKAKAVLDDVEEEADEEV